MYLCVRTMNREQGAYATAMSQAEWEAQTGNPWFQNLLTVEEVANRFGVTARTVRSWCESGLLKNAWKPTPRSTWLIPEFALGDFVPPRRGRPRREKEGER